MCCSLVGGFLDSVVVVFHAFDGSWVGAVSSFDEAFEDFFDGMG